jgi:hypothetical protein
VVYHENGKPSIRFDKYAKETGKWVISGPFFLGGQIIHVLKQVD